MPIPQSVKGRSRAGWKPWMDFRDVVHATQAQMLKQHGDNVFQGRIIEECISVRCWPIRPSPLHRLDRRDEAKASICIGEDETLIEVAGDRRVAHPDHDRQGMDSAAQTLRA